MSEYSPIKLYRHKKAKRRPLKPQSPPIPEEFIRNRQRVSAEVLQKISAVTDGIAALTPDQRKAIFLRVNHGPAINFTGTDLKPIFESGEGFTIVRVKDPELPNLKKKVTDFGTLPLKKGRAKNDTLIYNFHEITQQIDPYARVASELEERLEASANETLIVFEFEIVSLKAGKHKQKEEVLSVKNTLQDKYGERLKVLEHEEYYASFRVLAKATKEVILQLIHDQDVFQSVSWFDVGPTPQREVSEYLREFQFDQLGEIKPPAEDAPIVCIIDSGVNPLNPFLKPVLHPDIPPASYISIDANPGDGANHGSGVASMAAYHSLKITAGQENEAACWIVSAKVLNNSKKLEEEKLFSKTLWKIVSDYKAKGVRVFNLSIAFTNRVWSKEFIQSRKIKKTSWIARTIDNISRSEDVLFILCTGNIQLPDLNAFIGTYEHYPSYFRNDDFSLQDPAIASYAITVGSISGTASIATANRVAMSPTAHPSSFTRHGPGILKEIKPDVVEIGGCLAWDVGLNNAVRDPNLNVITASNQITPALNQDIGTSLAAPRVAYKAAKILTDLKKNGMAEPSINLLKAFMVNSTDRISFAARERDHLKEHSVKEESLVGYGQINSSLAIYNDSTNVQMFYEDKIPIDEILILFIPIPVEVASLIGRKRLKVTVVSSPEIQKSGFKRYHGSRMSWEVFRGDQTDEDIVDLLSAATTTEDENTEVEEEEVPRALKGAFGKRKRSKGLIQHDEFSWVEHRAEYSSHDYKLAILTQKKWGGEKTEIPVSVVVTFSSENSSNIPVDLHVLVRSRIKVKVSTEVARG